MVDFTAVRTATSCRKCLVVDKAIEHIVNSLSHYRLAPLQSAVPVTPRIAGVFIDKAVCTVLVVFGITAYQTTSNTQCTAPVFGAILFPDATFTES